MRSKTQSRAIKTNSGILLNLLVFMIVGSMYLSMSIKTAVKSRSNFMTATFNAAKNKSALAFHGDTFEGDISVKLFPINNDRIYVLCNRNKLKLCKTATLLKKIEGVSPRNVLVNDLEMNIRKYQVCVGKVLAINVENGKTLVNNKKIEMDGKKVVAELKRIFYDI